MCHPFFFAESGYFLCRCEDWASEVLRQTASNQLSRNGVLATRLCTHREDVTHINSQHIERLPGESKIFNAVDSDPGYSKQMDMQTPVLSKLVLKVSFYA